MKACCLGTNWHQVTLVLPLTSVSKHASPVMSLVQCSRSSRQVLDRFLFHFPVKLLTFITLRLKEKCLTSGACVLSLLLLLCSVVLKYESSGGLLLKSGCEVSQGVFSWTWTGLKVRVQHFGKNFSSLSVSWLRWSMPLLSGIDRAIAQHFRKCS